LLANRYPPFNDTGIIRCSDADTNGLTCPVPDFPRQDAQYGRDKTRNAAGNGRAGFNYTKLDANGKPLPANATAWDCVRDNVTGLIWERKPVGDGKIGNQGLHDADDHYTWYSTDSNNNGGDPGDDNRGVKSCFGYINGQPITFCNTEAFVKRVNVAGWCGAQDWRLPDRFELLGLVDLSIPDPGPTLDTGYFPDTISTLYWSSSPNANNAGSAWYVSFKYGVSGFGIRYSYSVSAVRLVRGGQ
jgi:hypothetical protein